MRNKVYKSKAASNTHQTVPLDHPVFQETLGFLDSLHTVYGRKRPIKYFACCNTFAVWKGTRGYAKHSSLPLLIEMFLGKADTVDTRKTLQILQLQGLADEQQVCVPGFDLECTNYHSLQYFKSEPSECNHKDGRRMHSHHDLLRSRDPYTQYTRNKEPRL
jgi:hypothetical protein